MFDNWTYGAEHELIDWDTREPIPDSIVRDHDDYTMVNSNGIANDLTGKLYPYGGEVNTVPTKDIEGQLNAITDIRVIMKDAGVNYRSNMHLHIRVPGLNDNLPMLQHIQRRASTYMPLILEYVDPIKPMGSPISIKRLKHSLRSRHTVISGKQLDAQLAAKTVVEFFNGEAPKDKNGKPQFQLVSRAALNLRSIIDNNTVEFRHWAGTLDQNKVEGAFNACVEILSFLMSDDSDPTPLHDYLRSLDLPRQMPVDDFLEQSYAMTSAKKVGKETAAANIKMMLGQ